jgi:hypothetical protein
MSIAFAVRLESLESRVAAVEARAAALEAQAQELLKDAYRPKPEPVKDRPTLTLKRGVVA